MNKWIIIILITTILLISGIFLTNNKIKELIFEEKSSDTNAYSSKSLVYDESKREIIISNDTGSKNNIAKIKLNTPLTSAIHWLPPHLVQTAAKRA